MEETGKQKGKGRKLSNKKVSQNISKEKEIYITLRYWSTKVFYNSRTQKSIQKYSISQSINNTSNQKSVRGKWQKEKKPFSQGVSEEGMRSTSLEENNTFTQPQPRLKRAKSMDTPCSCLIFHRQMTIYRRTSSTVQCAHKYTQYTWLRCKKFSANLWFFFYIPSTFKAAASNFCQPGNIWVLNE